MTAMSGSGGDGVDVADSKGLPLPWIRASGRSPHLGEMYSRMAVELPLREARLSASMVYGGRYYAERMDGELMLMGAHGLGYAVLVFQL